MLRTAGIALILVGLALVGCARADRFADGPYERYDKDTEYNVEDHDDGFTLSILYKRYQFIPESDAVAAAGKSALTSIAHEIGDKRGRPIEQINEQRIRMSMGRNGVTGITTWSGTVRVLYKKPGSGS